MEKPSLPKGTRDFGPSVMAKRQYILGHIRTVFQKFGYLPLETPALEKLTTLTGKYGEEGDQLLFKVLNNGDFLKDVDATNLSSRDSKQVSSEITGKGLRYDLTVPFARFVMMNRHDITFPFKRYQMQPVWRADRPQKGRYREFFQCDADVVGTDSLVCEAEVILMIKEVMENLGIDDYVIKVNHRGVLNGIAETLGTSGNVNDLFVGIDKLDKIGEGKVREELTSKGYTNEQLNNLFELLTVPGNNAQKLSVLAGKIGMTTSGKKGVDDLQEVFQILKNYGATEDHVDFDIAIARGLSYYTGCIFEVKLNNVSIGSISGGGRYDSLTQAFGSKEQLSGIGISFGIDRIFDALEELNLFPKETQVSSQVLVCHFDAETMNYGLGVLSQIRKAGIASELYPDVSKLKKQLDYANKKMIAYVLVIGPEEMKHGEITCKNMESGDQEKLSIEKIIAKLKR